jgi:hypothetical protein
VDALDGAVPAAPALLLGPSLEFEVQASAATPSAKKPCILPVMRTLNEYGEPGFARAHEPERTCHERARR